MYGRRVIYTDVDEINAGNVLSVLQNALLIHNQNRHEIKTLYDYYRGKQAIENRTKDIRPEINNKIVENRANEIVTFKTGYLVGEPIVYINRTEKDEYSDGVTALNEYMYIESKNNKDKKLVDWMHIAGTANRLALPRINHTEDEAPFEFYTLSPMNSFVIYSSGLSKKRMAGVKIVFDDEMNPVYSVWTDKWYFEVKEGEIINGSELEIDGKKQKQKGQPTMFGYVPMVEYPLNEARLGAFEIVLSMLDAINEVASDRLDGVDQFIQSLMTFCNCDIDEETFTALKELGALKYKSDSNNPAKVEILTQELNQMQTQTLVDYMYETILTICGMPNRNGGSSTSDTGSAVIMRDGWSAAEARAKDTENMFDESEKEFLKLILSYLRSDDETANVVPLYAIKPQFTRRNYENIVNKANVLVTMLGCNKIHPKLAFIHCGMFPDGEAAWAMSKEYYEQEAKAKQDALIKELTNHNADDNS